MSPEDTGMLTYMMFVLETNLKRLALRPENIEKVFNAELSKLGIGEEFNWTFMAYGNMIPCHTQEHVDALLEEV